MALEIDVASAEFWSIAQNGTPFQIIFLKTSPRAKKQVTSKKINFSLGLRQIQLKTL